MAMFINPNDPNRNKPLVQTYDPVAGTSTGLKPYTAKPAVSSNPVPSPAPTPTPRPSPTTRPTKVVGRNPVNTTPKFKSELYDKTVEAKKLSVVNPVTNPEKFTSAERGSLAFHMPDYLDRFKAVVENVKAGKATLPTVKQVKRAELIRFRDGQDYMDARDILSASTEEDERRYGLIKQARSVQSTIGMADDTEFPRIAKTLYEITNELDGRTDAPAWSDDYLKNPSLMQMMDDMLSNYEGQYAPLAYAEGVVENGEKLKKDADWFDNLDTPYQAMDVQERKLYQQNIAFEYAQGKKPIMFDLPDEYLKAEQENIDLNGLTEIAPGQSLPQFMVIADKNEQEVREQASILEDILATDHGALGDKARKNIEFDLDSLNDQLTAIDGFRHRYENANIKADAAEGEKAWRADMKPYAVSTSEDYESMFAFEDRWAKKLAENPNDKALIAQKEQEQIKLGATINRDKAGREILGYEDQYSDYYLVPVMTDQERATYMSYYKTDKAKAHEYAMALDQTLNKRASFELSELTKKLASGTIWEQGLSAVGSVLATVMKGISAIGIITKGITNQKIDPYAAYMEPAIVQQDIRGQLKKNTETAFGKDSIPTKSINLIGDILFGASDTIVGGKTLGFAGYMISGGSDSARDALLRGGNQDQALALMAANVAAEAITEAIPFDAIMGGFKKGFTWRGLFTSGFGEFVGEGVSSLLGSEADKEIMLENSYYETDVKEIEREKKISREEAEKIANKNILKDALYEGIVGLGSGDLAYMVSTRGRRAPKDTSAENAEVAKTLDDADLGAAITGIITEYDAGDNAPEAEQTEGQNPTTALEEQAAIDEASHEPDHTPQRPEPPAQQPISEQGAGETRAEDNQIAPQTAREYEDNDEVKAARAAYEAATAKVNEAIANGVLKPDAEWAAQDAAYQALNDAIDRQGQARIADEQARNPILNPAAEQTEVSSEPVQPADTSLVDALSKEYPVQTIPVDGIKVSPQEYQFKANVDETGVKDKIDGNYIPSYAGTVVVHERADGTRYIADGHHRLSLAARSGIKELQAIVLREADGITTAMARAFAAARNIASSRGTSIDAAKVFKETGITADGLYALGLSPNEKNVSEGLALSQVDPQLFDRIAQDEIPLKAGVLIGQIFPNDGTMQREFLRKMAGRNLSYDAMTELANVLKNAREVAATQEQVGFDFLDDPALTNAAEIAEVAARVKNMLARTLSTFKGLSGGKKVDQVGAVGGNEIDTEANRAEAGIALDAEIIMRTYWAADSPAFKLIDELAAQYAEGKLTLPKAAEQAYNAVSKIARDAINASKVDAAHGPAADSVAILIGAYGADQSRAFIGNALQAMNNTEYAIQQQTMRNIRDTMTLPIESTARQILDHMITGGKVDAGVLGSFNVAARQDLSNPIYNDARSNSADESAIANQTAKDIQAGAMQGFDERQALVTGLNDKANALQAKADEANAKYDQAKKAISALNDQSMQPDFVIDESFKKNRTDLQRKQTAAKKSLDKAVEQAQTSRKTADDAKAKFDADYAAQLSAIREKAIVSSQKAANEQGAPLIAVDDTIPVPEKERPKSPKNGQKQGTSVQAMYTNGRNATSQDTAISGMTPETANGMRYMGLNIEYNPSLPGEARNLTTKIQVGRKFFDLSNEQKLYVMKHEVAHNTTDKLLNAENFAELSKIFLTKKIGEKGSKIEGQEYWEGLFGDLGSSALSETITDAVVMYLNNPSELKNRSNAAYNFLDRQFGNASMNQERDTQYLSAVEAGDMDTAQKMVDEAAAASGLPILDDSASMAYRARRTSPPQKTIKAYKLFATKPNRPGELFPLFVGANEAIPKGMWLDAIAGQTAPNSKTGKVQVKSKLGPLAYRPGWHAGDIPLATHIGVKNADGKVYARRDNEVWAEIEVIADKDYQPQANASKTRDLREMPVDGAYRFKTNPNMTGEWIISGSMKINRVLSQNEVDSILQDSGAPTMPWESGPLSLKALGLTADQAINRFKLSDAVTYDDSGNIIPLSKRFDSGSNDIRYMYNVTTGGLPISAPTVDYSGPVQSAQTIFTKLGKAIGVPFNVNRRQYMRGLRNTTAGYFIPKSEVVHVKNAQDLTAASHEFGHWVDKRTRIGSHPAILRIVSQLMNDPVFSQNYSPQELNGEAVAEAMKVYMVNREQALAHLGKDFVAELEKGLSELGVLKEFDAARAALGRTIGASTFEQIKARIVSADESGKRTVKERIRNIRAKTFDSTLVFDEMSKMLRGLRGNNYMMSEDPRMIALKNNRIDNFVKAIIEDRLVNVRGDTILGRGFADNFEGISANEIKAFEAYLIAYHDLDRTKVGKSALGGEFTRQQILSTIAEVEAAHPGWKNNKAMLHEWYDAFFKEYIVKQGVIAQGEYDNMKAMYPNYVPTYRQMGDDAKGAPNKSSGDVKKGLLGAKESDLNIINPIESMARLIMAYTQQAHRLQLGNVFADAIDRYDATGVFAENIQKDIKHKPEIAAIKNEIEQMIAQQEEARQTTLFDSPLGDNPDLEQFEQNVLSLLDRSMFTMENTATGANVINILGRDGRYRSYLVHDANMLSVLQSVPSVQLTKVLQWAKNIVGMISATATGTNPFFALTNGVRDMATQMIYGTTSTNVLTAVPKWILNLPRTIAGILSNTTINGHQVLKDNRYTDAYRLYSMFSETAARYSAQIGKTSQTMVEALTSPNAAKKAGKTALKVFTMQFLNEMVENNSRFLEFYSGKSSLGKNRDNLNTFEGRLRAGLAASGVTVDFRRSGASPIMREIGAIVPFFNAGIQGINKAASLFTNENTGRRGQIAAKIVLNMTMLGVLQAVMNNMHLTDDEKEEYETFDEGYKAKSLFLKVGPEKLLRIPMTQDPISLIFYALGRAVGGAATGEGTSVADALVNGAKAVLTESTNFSTIYSPIQNLIENKTWYGSAIESSMMKGYARTERYNERTTGIAKWLSEKTGFLSPVQWDYIIPQYTGVWGKLGLNFVRNATGDATVSEALLETLNKEVSSRMFTTPAYTSQLYNNYKASLDGITQVKNHYRDNRPFSMFDPNLTQDELNLAVTEAHRMTKKGGELYDISEQISAKWDAYNQVLSNASLTDEQRDQGTIAVRQEINQLSLKGQNIIAGYESKYFPGSVRTNERVIGFNVREMTAQGVKEASSMTQTVYDDLQSGKPYAKDYADYSKGIYEKWGGEYILTTKPSKTWKGFNESTASPEKLAAIDRVYFTVVANGLKAQNQAILNAKSAEEADKLIKAITRKAADAAKEEALR